MSAQNSGETAKKQRGRPFRKGQSGNPGGRPKLAVDFVELCRNEGAELAWATLKAEMESGGDQRVKAAEVVLAYAYGKPKQGVEVAGEGGGPLTVIVHTLGAGNGDAQSQVLG